jgi:hypothetical protein
MIRSGVRGPCRTAAGTKPGGRPPVNPNPIFSITARAARSLLHQVSACMRMRRTLRAGGHAGEASLSTTSRPSMARARLSLNANQFLSIEDAGRKIESWRTDYNFRRPLCFGTHTTMSLSFAISSITCVARGTALWSACDAPRGAAGFTPCDT